MELLKITSADFSYPQSKRKTLSNINFSITGGEYVAVVGTNGSGKSTFARLAAGFIVPDSGKVEIDNDVLPGIVFQQPKEQIVAGIVSRDTAFGPQNLSMSKSEIELRTMECLSVTGLLDKSSSRTFELSLGQTQRLALSGIFALFPDLLILDEVTAMLDPDAREEILTLLDGWNRRLHAIIHITHDKDEVLRAKRVVAFDEGRIVFDGTVDEFFKTDAAQKIFPDENDLLTSAPGGGGEVEDDSLTKNAGEKQNESSTPGGGGDVENDLLTETTFENKNSVCLAVENLSFNYEDTKVFNNISFSLKKGTVNAITGPSGCGKSTLLETLAGLHTPSEGKIFAEERPVLALQESEAALFETFAADDVAFGPRNKGLSGKKLVECVKNSMELAGLQFNEYKDRQTFTLSGGEKRRLALAGIIAMNSSIILLDEPTAGLDPQSRKKVLAAMKKLASEGKTILFSTHRMDEARFADSQIKWKELVGQNDFSVNASASSVESNNSSVKTDASSVEQSISPVTQNTHPKKKQNPLPNSEMISSLQKTSAAFMSPSEVPVSPVSRLPAVLKYILFLAVFAATLAVRPFAVTAIMLAVCVVYSFLAKAPVTRPIKAFVKIFPWLIVFAIFQFWFFPAQPQETLLFKAGMFSISRSKILLVLSMIMRTTGCIFAITTFIFSTTEREILDGLDALLKPLALIKIPVRYFVLMVGIMFRFIPLLLDEAAGILKVQLVRGGLGKAKGFGKAKVLLPLFVPMMLQTFRKAEALADALAARYFR